MASADQQNVERGTTNGAVMLYQQEGSTVPTALSQPYGPRTFTYSEALEEAGRGRFHTLLLFVTGLCLMSVVNETVNAGFIISAAECDLHLTYADKGLLNGAAFLGVVVTSLVWGFLSDTWGRRNVLLLASGGAFIASVLSTFSPNAWTLIAARFLVGVFVSGNAATSYAYLAEFHNETSRARVISWAAMFMAIGLIFLPVLAWAIIPLEERLSLSLFGYRYPMWRLYLLICSVDLVFIVGGLLLLPESAKFLLIKDRQQEVLHILAKIYHYNQRQPEQTFPVKLVKLDPIDSAYAVELQRRSKLGLQYVWQQIVPLLQPPLLLHTLKASVLMCGLFAASSGLFLWLPDILNAYIQRGDMKLCDVITLIHEARLARIERIGNYSDVIETSCPITINANIFVITALMGIVFLACYILNGLIIGVIGKKTLLISWFVVCGICGLGVLLTSDFYITLILIATFDASGCLGGVLSAISVDLFPTNYRAMALCLILMTGRLGAMAGSNLIAYLLSINCNLIFILFGGLLLVCAAIGTTLKVT
ncbi:synaptic vesicle glycoprotein 2A-like isoform X1 [Anopheles albimanus]|uniref:Major facilitator superfamily (MFS) profile domain-containing protein n=2 Tax=Anopheles albimanus TaxID=7167 RepID=A0A182FIY3_ANOAL|nr:synaptic vesicle glycoprotein 2A-like isoform X1 [Anopheles albimanus]